MGYTHYWRYKPSKIGGWEARIEDCDKIVEAAKVKFELDLEGSDDKQLWLNGPNDARDLNHETFGVPRTLAGIKARVADDKKGYPQDASMHGFDFCKTARKPYDTVVTACLCVLAESGLSVSSDGDTRDWEAGRALAQDVLGRSVANPIAN